VSTEEGDRRLRQIANAVEDLLQMGVLRLDDTNRNAEKALLSPQFSIVVSNVLSNTNIDQNDDTRKMMNLMYFSLLIYINEYLKIPKSLTIALGNDLEKNRDNMESGGIITSYVSVLAEIWAQNVKK